MRFSLKKAIAKLGPGGFLFEKYIGEIFSRMGFKVKNNQEIPAFCCHYYEIDLLAQKNNSMYVIECKYRSSADGRVHSDIALANYARFLDIKNGGFLNGRKSLKLKSLIVTNSKFTDKTIDYSKCVGVELLGWRYPKDKGLEYLIESRQFYPITILPSLNKGLTDILIQRDIILIQDILKIDAKKFAKKTKTSFHQLEYLINEAKILLE